LVVVHAPVNATELECIIEVVEIENKLKDAIRSRQHGLNQLKKYPGHMKFLAIPETIHRLEPQKIENKCKDRGIGLLVVGRDSEVRRVVNPPFDEESKGIRAYSSVRRRWSALKKSRDRFRWIRKQVIYRRE